MEIIPNFNGNQRLPTNEVELDDIEPSLDLSEFDVSFLSPAPAFNFSIHNPNSNVFNTSVQRASPISIAPAIQSRPKPQFVIQKKSQLVDHRYRSNINDKMTELKVMLFGDESRASKSAVLRKAVDHIRYLELLTSKLKQELENIKHNHSQAQVAQRSQYPSPTSIFDSNEDSSTSSDSGCESWGTSSSGGESPISYIPNISLKSSLTDKGRITVCCFVILTLFIDPTSLLTQQARPIFGGGSRRLFQLNEDSVIFGPVYTFQFCIKCLILLILICKLFLFGEPTLHSKCSAYHRFCKHRQIATKYIEKRQATNAAKHIKIALHALGRPVAISKLDICSGYIWQIFRLMLQRTQPGRWLLRRLMGIKSPRCKDEDFDFGMVLAKEAALLYNQLHDLYLTGHIEEHPFHGFLFGLNALVLADFTFPLLRPEIFVEIILTMAVSLHLLLPKIGSPLTTILRMYATRYSVGCVLSSKVDWMLQSTWWLNEMSNSPTPMHTLFSCTLDTFSPLECINQRYRHHQLQIALDEVLSGNPNVDVVQNAQVAITHFKTKSLIFNEETTANADKVAVWLIDIIKSQQIIFEKCLPIANPSIAFSAFPRQQINIVDALKLLHICQTALMRERSFAMYEEQVNLMMSSLHSTSFEQPFLEKLRLFTYFGLQLCFTSRRQSLKA